MKKVFLPALVAFLAVCVIGGVYFAVHYVKDARMREHYHQYSEQEVRDWIKNIISLVTAIGEDEFAKELKNAMSDIPDELKSDVFLQMIESSLPSDSRDLSIKYLYAEAFVLYVNQEKIGNVYFPASLKTTLSILLTKGDVPDSFSQDPAGFTAARDVLKDCDDIEPPLEGMPLNFLYYDEAEYKKLSRQFYNHLRAHAAMPEERRKEAKVSEEINL